ncbi:MAG: aminopeptidase P family N-terminal domain-containing protein, partial [Muribaculaceae bacterium]|nr:aminopeptidase P family N-terminal domain-containing protein [Muribaculaceae bacterium]
MKQLLLLDKEEHKRRVDRVVTGMKSAGLDAVLLADNASKYYLTGRVYAGYIYMAVDGTVICAVQRPVELNGSEVAYIRKPEELPSVIGDMPRSLGLELDTMSYNNV